MHVPAGDAKRLIVVVPGIGDDEAGDAVRPLARALAGLDGHPLEGPPRVVWLLEGGGRELAAFPCPIERVRKGSGETVLAEVSWADLSRVPRGVLGTAGGLLRLLFGLRHLARHAADPRRPGDSGSNPWAHSLLRFTRVVSYLLRGPLTAVFLLMIAYRVVMTVVYPTLREGLGLAALPGMTAWVVGAGAVGLALGWRRLPGKPSLPPEPLRWMAFLSPLYLLPALLWVLPGGRQWFSDWLALLPSPATPESEAFGFLVIASIGFLTYLLLLAVLGVVVLLSVLAWGVGRLRASERFRPGMDAALMITAGTVAFWLLVTSTVSALVVDRIPEASWPDGYRQAIVTGSWGGIGLWLGLGVIMVTVWASWLSGRRWAANTTASSYRGSRRFPRLLVGAGVTGILIVGAFVGPAAYLAGLAYGWNEQILTSIAPLGALHLQLSAVIGGAAIYFVAQMRIGLDLGLDVVDHFRPENPATGEELVFPIRERILDRFAVVLATLVEQENPADVTVIAHSQGTIIAIEALRRARGAGLDASLPPLHLVTMGSPFHHLYQHYFTNDYPPLSDPAWENLRRSVKRWHNIFRIDDFVGTEIECGGSWPVNDPVDPGGHTGYWTDRQVLEILVARGLV